MKRSKAPARKKPTPRRAASPSRRGLRITRVYTRTGDQGRTRLVGGREVSKADARLEAYGTVDELSVWIAEARERLASLPAPPADRSTVPPAEVSLPPSPSAEGSDLLGAQLRYLQNLLFTLGGDLATRLADRWPGMPVITPDDVAYLEKLIDGYNAALPPLKDFVVPGGGGAALALHHGRVVCRRAERAVARLSEIEPVGPSVLPFLNRFSDLLFVWARWVGRAKTGQAGAGPAEPIWDRAMKPPEASPPRTIQPLKGHNLDKIKG